MDPFALNVAGALDLVNNRTNKMDDSAGQDPEGIQGEMYDALELPMSDEELLKLRDEWEKKYAPYEVRHKRIVERNLESYLGKKANDQWLGGEENISANLQFEAEETFLAATLAKNPDPVVYADNTDQGNQVSDAVETMLTFHADQLVLRKKFIIMVRQWSIHHLGVLKVGWDTKYNDVSVENRKIENYVFDPEGYVDAYGNFIGYLGERIEVAAEVLVGLFPKSKAYIESIVEGKMGSKVVYTEWYSADNTYCFTTFKDEVLEKHKNIYFKYPEPQTDPLGQPVLDPMGEPVMTQPRNHFAVPQKPHIFLSLYSLQTQPHDLTGLIEQNIPNQRLIARETDQVDFNASAANNSFAFSEDNFNQETGKQASNARRKGNPILIPSGGPIDKAILPLDAQPLPQGLIDLIEVHKNDLRSSWGIQGIASQQPDEETTARGMLLNQSHDTSRIGGGIGQAAEGVAKTTFNWLVQLYYVFYDEQHFAPIMGGAKAVEYVELSNQDLDRQLIVSVAPDSLRPKDAISEANLATSLFQQGAIGPKTLLQMLDYPNAEEAAADGVLYRLDPQAYFQMNFPQYAQQLQAQQQQNAQLQMQTEAQGAGMNAAATAANTPQEEGATPESPSQEPANAQLNQVPLPK